MILAFAGLKGGQGKTTLAVRVAAWLARAGHRTVLVDAAPTGSASALLGFGGAVPGPGAGELLARRHDIVVVDLPPSQAGIALATLATGAWIIVPVVPDELGVAGLRSTLSWLKGLRPLRQRSSRLAGIVLNQVESGLAGCATCETALRAAHARDVFKAGVRRDNALRVGSTLSRVFRDRAPRGGDLDVRTLRSELLKLLVKRG